MRSRYRKPSIQQASVIMLADLMVMETSPDAIANADLDRTILRRSREKYRSVFDGLDIPIAIYRRDGVLMMMNAAAAAIRGGTPGDFIGQTIAGADSGMDALDMERIRAVVESTESCEFEAALERPEGIRWFRTVYRPLRLETGEVFAVQVVSHDFTKSKLAEERIKKDQEKLKSMASQVSLVEEKERRHIALELHDQVGQILATAKMKLGRLKKMLSDELQVQVVDEVDSLCEQAIRYIRSLTLELSPPILYELGLDAAVEWLLDKQGEQHDIEFHLDVDQRPRLIGKDLRVLLFQSIRELLCNVIKHARAKRVSLTIRREDKHIVISVEDDGVGFDPGRVNNGLFGLYSIRERLDWFGGNLELHSAPGQGTRATIRAPLTEP